jgi:endonuclease/exonuclease/phosphatase family metal-dependent hydrolase
MPMKIASFNVENMFRRPKVFLDPKSGTPAKEALEAYTQLTQLLAMDSYAGKEDEILAHLRTLGLERVDDGEFAVLRKIRGKLLYRPEKPKPVEVEASGRSDWIGWVELERDAIDSTATENTARVIADVDPDVLAVVEAEDRMALERFNEYVLQKVTLDEEAEAKKAKAPPKPAWRFAHAMLVDGNDERGIDVGLMSKDGFPIGKARSHIDDEKGGGRIFSRDCAEYEIPTPTGGTLLLMVNHFKSKIGGGDKRRREQAQRVAEIYAERRREGHDLIAVCGDFNDTFESKSLVPLLAKTDLKDAGDHDGFDWGSREGTYEDGDRIDYILLSPSLSGAFVKGGVNRRGIWRPSEPDGMLPTLKKEEDAASDHAAIWVELNV